VGEPVAIVTGLTTPWSLVFLGETALVSSRDTGDIFELVGDTMRLVGTVPGVVHQGESGLLGLAIDDSERLYTYSTSSSDNRIQRFTITGEPGSLGLGAGEVILDGIPFAGFHDGGRIAFGPDGMLYATTGDAGVRPASQDMNSLGGKILRMTADGGIPDDNPFPGSHVYTLGHRNPQGIAWDAEGRLFASEFGQDTWDELNIITAGSNYGWPEVEGIAGNPTFVDPVQQWNPDTASPSGITIVDGTVFIANLKGQRVRTVPVANPSTETTFFEGSFGRIRDVAYAPDGSLWFLTSNTDTYGTPRAGDDRIMRVELGS
jgi:glucose/arabinose dehydrogenase